MTFTINPATAPSVIAATVNVNVASFDPARGVEWELSFVTPEGLQLKAIRFWMEGDDYTNWPTGQEPSPYLKSFLVTKPG